MCSFPSWITTEDGKAVFLTDKDVVECEAIVDDNDAVGHHAILVVYPNAKGSHEEDFPCHPDVAKAIRTGKLRKQANRGGYKTVHVNTKGSFHNTKGPACEYANGDKLWYRDGKCHREDGPAIELANGDKLWYRDGKLHREDGPAIEYANGGKHWYRDGERYAPDAALKRGGKQDG